MLRYDSFGLQVDAIWRSRCYTYPYNSILDPLLQQVHLIFRNTHFISIVRHAQFFLRFISYFLATFDQKLASFPGSPRTRIKFPYFKRRKAGRGLGTRLIKSLVSNLHRFRCRRAGCSPMQNVPPDILQCRRRRKQFHFGGAERNILCDRGDLRCMHEY